MSSSPGQVSRRGALALFGLAGLGLSAGLSACDGADPTPDASGGSPLSSSEQPTPPTADTGVASGGAPASAADLRVVTLDPFSTQDLLDFGLTPVGCQAGLEDVLLPAHRPTYDALPKIGTYNEPKFEQIFDLHPDLIIASSGQIAAKDKLEPIAKTVFIEGVNSTTWQKAAQQVADFVGRQDELAQLEGQYRSKAAEIKSARAPALASTQWALVWRGEDAGFYVRAPNSNCGQVLTDAGAQFAALPKTIKDGKDILLSWEKVAELTDAGAIGVPAKSDGSTDPTSTVILENRLFGTLPAVQAGHTATFAHFTPGSYKNAIALLGEFDAYLAKAA